VKPLDPRLLRAARATRTFLALTTIIAAALAALIVAQAVLLARVITAVFLDGAGPADVRADLVALVAVVGGRAVLIGVREGAARVASGQVKADLRRSLLRRVAELGPGAVDHERRGELATLATRGVDAFDPWFAGYLPQLVQAAVMPAVLIVWVLRIDPASAAVLVVTLPLIPVFMALVGLAARARTERQWHLLASLSGRFLDAVEGLASLRLAGRAGTTRAALAAVGEEHRRATMGSLRVAFLSALVLELFATIATAVIAVGVGLRVVYGHLDLEPALTVLILAPEVYLPLRLVGSRFHASMDALTTGDRIFAILELPAPPGTTGTRPAPDPRREPISFHGVHRAYPARDVAVLDRFDAHLPAGGLVAVTGPSGAGKSTLLALLAGLDQPDAGAVRVGSVDLADIDPTAWRARVAWVPQRPHLVTGTVADNLRLARSDADVTELWAALDALGIGGAVRALPHGLDTPLGEDGAGLSAGQRHRLAVARALVRDADLVVLDEPTAEVDATSAVRIAEAVRALAADRTVVVATHDPRLRALADHEVSLAPAGAGAGVPSSEPAP